MDADDHPSQSAVWKHPLHMVDSITDNSPLYMQRSVMGLISVYNDLPAEIVKTTTVSGFPMLLQHSLKDVIRHGNHDWRELFCPQARKLNLWLY